jgi:hypothetical protein
MAGTVGRITGALATVHNENSASLANVNFDFTLVKFEAPLEYTALGHTISKKRKIDAEEGILHKTARRLGALFGDILPPSEDLFRAYGTRVSEIASTVAIDPSGTSNKQGVFANHIGVDSTSIWAAVTSGSAAIAAHLLGCMLARIFTGPEAVSVWVELVQKQKERIRRMQGSALYSHEHVSGMVAAQQDISRADLASWDASARAWLQSADQARSLQHKQTMLILNNAGVPVNTTADTYASVMEAWTSALEAMNSLVKGMPQRVQDGAALLAISSWHLYPDMVVYGTTCVEVKQKDPIFDKTALLTLGLQDARDQLDDMKSVHWSLPLACLQYYGHPVQTHRSLGQDNSRITCEQFGYIILGCLFDGWKTYAASNEEGLRWMGRLGTILDWPLMGRFNHLEEHTWLQHLLAATRELVDCEEVERTAAHQLINLGRRRSTFLNSTGHVPPPLFGLSNLSTLLSILKGDEERIQCLRRMPLCGQLGPQFLIKYKPSGLSLGFEYATTKPFPRSPAKRNHEGNLKDDDNLPGKCVRWISLSLAHLKLCDRRSKELSDVSDTLRKLEGLKRLQRDSFMDSQSSDSLMDSQSSDSEDDSANLTAQDILDEIEDLTVIVHVGQRLQDIQKLGELCLPVVEFKSRNTQADEQHSRPTFIFGNRMDFHNAARDLLAKLNPPHPNMRGLPTWFFAGVKNLAALVFINPSSTTRVPSDTQGPKFLGEVFTASNVDRTKLDDYLRCSSSRTSIPSHPFVRTETAALRAFAMMVEVYRDLPGATISTLVVRQSIRRAKWIPKFKSHAPPVEKTQSLDDRQKLSLTLSQAFACVAMFESGTCNLDPEALSEVFALSSGNSLYVAGALLCDPYEVPSSSEIKRVVGNIGRAGITFLISPPEVKLKEADPERWMTINHNTFNGKLENHFDRTSIHLSFTEYEVPLLTESHTRHTIDRDIVLVEALLSVYDGGTWIGEIDILKVFKYEVVRVPSENVQNGDSKQFSDHNEGHISHKAMIYEEAFQEEQKLVATSIENWDELNEAPKTGVVAVRAHKDWIARLAATAICADVGFKLVILPADPCWTCCAKLDIMNGNDRLALIC